MNLHTSATEAKRLHCSFKRSGSVNHPTELVDKPINSQSYFTLLLSQHSRPLRHKRERRKCPAKFRTTSPIVHRVNSWSRTRSATSITPINRDEAVQDQGRGRTACTWRNRRRCGDPHARGTGGHGTSQGLYYPPPTWNQPF